MDNNNTINNCSCEYYLPKDSHTRKLDDRREIELLHYVYNHPNLEQVRGSPAKVLGLIDEFGRNKAFLMNVGKYKGEIVTNLIEKHKPQTIIELGSYVGYSAILFADTLRRVGGKKYYSLERNPEYAAVATMLVDLAGLRDVVKILVGNSDVLLHRLCTSGEVTKIDLMFLDHFKAAYVTDLKLCEQLNMIAPGTVLAADNVIVPGNPAYLEYVRSSVETKRQKATYPTAGYEIFSQQIMSWYVEKDAKPAFEVVGNPNLIYESKLIESIEPSGELDGVEVTRCIGVQESK
ncbi:O-methyltransferase [Emydomyces testavorans]|uniref:catechol O-methyltransferase n=1 Tax=Emydomyces testavorans TaxID=2070801 RepID=A0AAF0IH70_9EURO|nr:O-methyltransferase [Emydomyces testavorans]